MLYPANYLLMLWKHQTIMNIPYRILSITNVDIALWRCLRSPRENHFVTKLSCVRASFSSLQVRYDKFIAWSWRWSFFYKYYANAAYTGRCGFLSRKAFCSSLILAYQRRYWAMPTTSFLTETLKTWKPYLFAFNFLTPRPQKKSLVIPYLQCTILLAIQQKLSVRYTLIT